MKKKILLLAGAVVGLGLVTGISYAYFTTVISGNNTAKDNAVTTGTMELTFTDGDVINLTNAFPGNTVSKTFTIRNSGTLTTTYDIKLVNIVNTFVDKNDLTYSLTCSTSGVNLSNKVVPSTTSSTLVSDVSIASGVTHTYTLTITFKKTNDNQNDNQGVKFSGKINIAS